MTRRASRLRLASTGAGLVVLALALSACGERASLPEPGSEAYHRAVSSFHVGLASAQVGLDREAEEAWLGTTAAAPGEPAAWAGLATLALRRNELDLAAERMERAVALAPESPRIRYAAGVLAVSSGIWEEARGHLIAAVDADPGNLPALFALAELAERSGRDDDGREARRWLERILEVAPANLATRLERARVLAKQGDAAALERALDDLRADAGGWPPEARERLDALEGAPATAAAPRVAMLANVLKRAPEYRESLRAVKPEGGAAGVLVERFVRLSGPEPGPAPADTTLAYRAESIPVEEPESGARSDAVTVRAVALDAESRPIPLVATAEGVRVGRGAFLPFPGGTSGEPPTRNGVLAADLDNDYRMELVLAGAGGLRIYAADSIGKWSDVTAERGVPPSVADGAYVGAWAVDLDLEGDLDLVLGSVDGPPAVLIQGADGRFRLAGEPPFQASALRDLAWADLDGDGDPDLAVLDGDGTLRVLMNRGAGAYEPWRPPEAVEPVLALAVADLDGDEALDLVGLADGPRIVDLPTPERPDAATARVGPKSDLPVRRSRGEPGSRRVFLAAADLDNNGCADLVASIDGASGAWLCDARGERGSRAASRAVSVPVDGSVTDAGDVDADGRIDLLGVIDGRPVVHRAHGSAEYGWIRLRPRAAERAGDQRVNAFGLGGEIEVRSGLLYRKLPIDAPVVHAGLGERSGADLARTVWPNGLVQVEFDLRSTDTVAIRQRLMGSCPWLFVFDGERMRFVTDVVWPSPLGARLNAETTAPIVTTEDRTRIPGTSLVARDGVWDVRITTELWESFFIDDVSLIAVDHPPGTIVRVDERFAFRPLDLSARAFEPERPVAGARDRNGDDVTAIVRARDWRTLGPEPGPLQGLAPGNAVEIDLGAEAAGRDGLVLLATGWVAPIESAGRIALSQGTVPAPRDLVLEVADGRGGWVEARARLGMPAGKDKTIVIPLDGLFPPGAPPRVRLSSDLEIAWDAFAWTVELPDAPIERHEATLVGATLQFRGFSVRRTDTPTEAPLYDRIESTGPRWRDLEGYYTRYGPVEELLAAVDDRYVIMNAGDEIRLRYRELAPPLPGWTRDFVLVTDGWGRNGDYGTEFSTTLLPLPSHDRASYPERPERLEDDPVYRRHPDDWRRYHTRYVTPEPFRRALVPE